MHNNTPFTWDEIASMPVIGTTVNNWRGRHITLRQHPHWPDSVVSVGVTFDGAMTVAAVEEKSDWAVALEYASRGKVYTSD